MKIIKLKNKKAQAIVEFALIFPILIATIMCIFEFGLLLKNYLGLNYALGKAAKEAAFCRGQEGADVKVIKSLLASATALNYTNLRIVSSTGQLYGPYKLGPNKSLLDANNLEVTSIGEELFFYNDNGTPNNPSDDTKVNPANASMPSYAKIRVRYTHTLINAQILGLEKQGTFNLELTMQARLAPQ
ncbi:MAG TPA: TadE/TadG family type IV pilus assembly protein [Candidatus Wallbacteria bacterium]|nr:TadE/TadG family type IV pilus assembly protein [Candidatus Wallbacteria bacterium]HPG56941.1 TadE/TadG family type IV pilus assembly protein [Candidatus Wallbacteria bacterium]